MRILLADDEEIVHQTIGSYLSDLGHHVDKAQDVPAALKSIESREYDLMLIDIRMPGMNGLSLLPKLKDIRPDMSVVLITGHGDIDMATQALKIGVADFLTKPIRLLELDATLERISRLHLQDDQREKLEAKLKQMERRHHLIAENVTDLVWEMDMSLRCIYINPAVISMLGYSVEEVEELICKGILSTNSLETVKEIYKEELNCNSIHHTDLSRSQKVEMELIRKDGSSIFAEVKFAFLRDSNNQPVGILGIVNR